MSWHYSGDIGGQFVDDSTTINPIPGFQQTVENTVLNVGGSGIAFGAQTWNSTIYRYTSTDFKSWTQTATPVWNGGNPSFHFIFQYRGRLYNISPKASEAQTNIYLWKSTDLGLTWNIINGGASVFHADSAFNDYRTYNSCVAVSADNTWHYFQETCTPDAVLNSSVPVANFYRTQYSYAKLTNVLGVADLDGDYVDFIPNRSLQPVWPHCAAPFVVYLPDRDAFLAFPSPYDNDHGAQWTSTSSVTLQIYYSKTSDPAILSQPVPDNPSPSWLGWRKAPVSTFLMDGYNNEYWVTTDRDENGDLVPPYKVADGFFLSDASATEFGGRVVLHYAWQTYLRNDLNHAYFNGTFVNLFDAVIADNPIEVQSQVVADTSATITGTMRAGLTVQGISGATFGTITYPTSTTWSMAVSGLAPGNNTIMMAAYSGATLAGSASGMVSVGATPLVAAFSMPAYATSYVVPVTAFSGSDGVVGYMITESSTPPSASDPGWASSPPTSFTFLYPGVMTAFAWTKNAFGLVSASASATVTIIITPRLRAAGRRIPGKRIVRG